MIRRAVVSAIVLGLSLPWLPAQGAAPKTKRVSVRSNGAQGDNFSVDSAISGNGRFVAFRSDATNLVGGDDNATADVFVYDRKTKKTKRVSVRSNGTEGDGPSYDASISANGRLVAFSSDATNLVAGDDNGAPDNFVYDRKTKKTKRVSVRSNGTEGDGDSYEPSISANGRFVAFSSEATNLVAGDDNGYYDVFVHDRKTKKTKRVSVRSNGTEGDDESLNLSNPSISGDGRFVTFESVATNLVAGDTNGDNDVFVHDRKTKKTKRVSVRSNGTEGDDESSEATISANGRFVAFESDATNLVSGDTNGIDDVFVHDRKTKKTKRVSVRSNGDQGDDESEDATISANGRFVTFESDAANLVAGDTISRDVFVYDRKTKKTKRVSVRSNGTEGDGESFKPSISGDGRFVTFESLATNLVGGDTNMVSDIFMRGPLR